MPNTSASGSPDFGFGDPATYRIVVQGLLDTDWSDRLAGLAITTASPETGPPRSILEGRIHDQAELNGVLTTLYELHVPLLSVEKLKDARSGGGPQ